MYDEVVFDILNPNRTTRGWKKADKLGCLGGYLPKNIAFGARPGLSSCIQDIVHLFLPLYTLEEYRTSEQEEQLSKMMVSKEVNGGVEMIKLIQDLLKEAEVLNKTDPKKWPANDKAEKQ